MKKWTAVTLTLLTCGIVHALPVGNPLDPMLYTNHFIDWKDSCDPCSHWYDPFNIRLGFYGDYVFNRELKAENGNGSILNTKINTNAGLITISFCDWIEVFGTIGVSNFAFITPYYGTTTRTSTNNVDLEHSFSPTMSYSVGGRALIWNCNCFYLGVEGQYFYSQTELNSITSYDTGTITYFDNKSDRNTGYNEWQVGLSASYLFEGEGISYIPYTALQFAGVSWNLSQVGDGLLTLSDHEEAKLLGWTLGLAIVVNDLIGVSCEARFANEKALSVIGQLSF